MPTDLSLEITELFQQVIAAKQEMAAAEERFRSLQKELIHIVEARQISELGLEDDKHKYTARVIRTESTVVDEISLKKALGARAFNKLCTQRVDKAKLQQAMTLGVVDPIVVAQHTVIKAAAPYLRITSREVTG